MNVINAVLHNKVDFPGTGIHAPYSMVLVGFDTVRDFEISDFTTPGHRKFENLGPHRTGPMKKIAPTRNERSVDP